jgi:hypothetical protein
MEWISVKDRVPNVGRYVICYTENRVFSPTNDVITKYSKYGFEGASNVTHWMPLPEPPKQS